MQKKYYVAYGSNLNIPQMRWRCPDAEPIGTATLQRWELLFKGSKTGSYLTIEKNPDKQVPVAIWEVSKKDEEALDFYEGYPTFYYKKNMKVDCVMYKTGEIKTIDAFVYIMHEDRPIGIPSKLYLQVCAFGYDEFGFDRRHLLNAYNKSIKEAV